MTEEAHGTDGEPAGDLNEVLRLQAVALARMSERMDAYRTGPVKPAAPVSAAERHAASRLPVLASDVALSEDSLPVLNAFREFLDQERRRTRARILWVSLTFALLFAATVAAVLWMGRERVRELRHDIGATNKRVDASLQDASVEIRRASEAAGRTVNTLKRDVSSTLSLAQSAMASNLNAEMKARDDQLALLKEKLSSLEIENAVLVGRLREAAREVEARAQALREQEEAKEAVRDPGESAAPAPTPVAQEERAIEYPVTNGSPADVAEPPIVIQTPAYNRPVRLKMPTLTP